MFIYCGDGQKHETVTYYPVSPPVMMCEVPEKKPCAEPNPTEEWLAAQQNKTEVVNDDE